MSTTKITPYYKNFSNYVPVWARTAVIDLEAYLSNTSLISKVEIDSITYWKDNKFVLARFNKLSTLGDMELEALDVLGWKFYWFQDFGTSYTIQLKYKKDG